MNTITLAVQGTPPFAQVTAQRFLDALNTGKVFAHMHRAFIHFWAQTAHPTFRKNIPVPSAQAYETANTRFRDLLRKYVDQYIETAREPGGVEIPAQRKFREDVVATIMQFDRPPLLYTPEGLEIIFAPYGQSDSCGLFQLAEREAARFLFWLFVSDWRNTIAKCRNPNCGRYRQIRSPGYCYKRGTYCRGCSSANSAAIITTTKWKNRHERRLHLAAQILGEQQSKVARPRANPLKQNIVRYVNHHSTDGTVITAKWVTRNLREIELRAKQLENQRINSHGNKTDEGATRRV
jgi:hypothetical protein